MKKIKLGRIIFELLTVLFIMFISTYIFFHIGVGFAIDVWAYFLNGITALFSEKEVLMFFAFQIVYFFAVYYLLKRKVKSVAFFDYIKEIFSAVVFIPYGISVIGKTNNEFLIILVIISILGFIGFIISFLIKISIKIYKLNEPNSNFYLYRILYKYKIQSLIAILVISSQLIILIYSFLYFRFNLLLAVNEANIGLKQGNDILKNFSDIYYFSSVTFFTVGYGDVLPYGDNLKLLVTSEMIAGFIMNLLFVPVLFAFILNLFSEKSEKIRLQGSFIEPMNMSETVRIPCFNFQDIKNLKHHDLDNLEKFELIESSFMEDLNIPKGNSFYVDIVDDSLSMLNIFDGDKLLVTKQADLIIQDLGMFFLDNDSKKIIFGNVKHGRKVIGSKEKDIPITWVEGYWNNCLVLTETVLPIGKVIYIKRKQLS